MGFLSVASVYFFFILKLSANFKPHIMSLLCLYAITDATEIVPQACSESHLSLDISKD